MRSSSLRPVVEGLQLALAAILILWAADVPSRIGLALYTEQFMAAALALTLALVLLKFRATRGSDDRVPWYDLAAATWSLLCCGYLAVAYPELVDRLVELPAEGMIAAITILVMIIEATRRTAGPVLVIVILVMCAYAWLGHFLPGQFASRPVSVGRLVMYLGLDTNALLGVPLQVALIIVAPFILMGLILTASGGSDYFTELSAALMGRYRGGAAKIAVVGSALFGMISGSAVANVASVGVVTIPLMKRSGFPPQVAASIEAVGSTGGQLMPPVMGAAAFLMAEYLRVPYSEVMVAAVLPAVIYYVALFIQVDLEAAKRGITGAPMENLPTALNILRIGWIFPIPFIILVLGLVAWNFQAEYAALLASGALLLLAVGFGYKGRRLTLGAIYRIVVSFGASVLEIVVITAAAGVVIGVLNITGVAFGLTLQLLALSQDSTFILLVLTAAIAILLGMGMPTVGVYVVLATLAAPALIKSGISPMQAHMFVMYFGMMSMVTPPVALAAFAAANIAEADPWRTGWTATRIGWCAYIVPFLFAYSPSLLLRGDCFSVIGTAITAIFGVFMGSVAVVGYLRTQIGALKRVAFGILGVALLLPTDLFAGAVIVNVVAVAVACVLVALEVYGGPLRNRRPAQKAM